MFVYWGLWGLYGKSLGQVVLGQRVIQVNH